MDDPEWQVMDHTAYYEESGLSNDLAVNPAVAQAFKVYGAIDIVNVTLRFNRTNSTPNKPDDNITVSIRSSLTGDDLANGTRNSTNIAVGSWTGFDLIPPGEPPLRLNSSQTYYIVVNRTGTDASNYMSVYVGSTTLYEDGNAWNYTGGADPWEELESWDLDFRVYHDTSCTDCHGGRERKPVFQVPKCDKCHNQTATGVLNTNTDIPPYGLKDVVHGRANWSCGEAGQCHGERHNKTTVACTDCHITWYKSSCNGTDHRDAQGNPVGDNYTIENHAFNESGWNSTEDKYGVTCLQCHDNQTVNITGKVGENVYTGLRNMQTMIHATNGSYMSRDNCTVVCHWKNVSNVGYPYNYTNHFQTYGGNPGDECSDCHYRPNTNYVPAYHSAEITSYRLVLWMTANKTEDIQNNEHIEINVSVNNTNTVEYSNVIIVGGELGRTGTATATHISGPTPSSHSIAVGETKNFTFVYRIEGSSAQYVVFSGQAQNETGTNVESNIYELKVTMSTAIPEFPLGLVLPIVAPALIYLVMRRRYKLKVR
jgi:hypothetical protein